MNQKQIEDFESRFLPFNNVFKFIADLKSIDLTKIELSDLDNLIDEQFHLIPFTLGNINKGKELIRARVNENNKQFTNIRELGMPPIEKITKYGRANSPKERIFYSSQNRKLACGEVLQDLKYLSNPVTETRIVTISVWEIISNLNLATIYYSPEVIKYRKDVENFKKGNQDLMNKTSKLNENTIKTNDLITEFFCDEFAKDNIKHTDEYKFSVLYTNRLREGNQFIAPEFAKHKFDGILYPSVAMKYKGDNIALFDFELDTKIKFKTAYEVVCLDFDFDKPDFDIYLLHELIEIKQDGTLIWNSEIPEP